MAIEISESNNLVFSRLSDQDLRDIIHAMNLAVRQLNIYITSEVASRFINLETSAREELRRRGCGEF